MDHKEPGLFSVYGSRIALQSVHIEGRLDEALAAMTITQRYRNDSGKKLEIVYTFPLAWGAELLGLEVILGNKRLRGAVAEKEQAWTRYENALDDGNAAVLVEQSEPGLYTANLGSIENGEDITVELRYAQLPHCEYDSLRLTIPCAIAPRYGDQHRGGGLSPRENAEADVKAEYPLSLRILLRGQADGAKVECPSHPCGIESAAHGTMITLRPGAWLDRDFILTVKGAGQNSFALAGPDIEGDSLVLARFRPVIRQTRLRPLRLKILADCSGSMTGDSIRSLRNGLFGLPEMLEPGDRVSYSRFGSEVCHETRGFLAWGPDFADSREALVKAFERTEADMGGTEMERALLSTFNDINLPRDNDETPCVLLITDGAVWAVESIVRAARASGQRIFAIGAGSAPAESLLRRLALETGGACAFVSPNESMAAVVRRMTDRMRGAAAGSLRVDWGREPVRQSALPLNLYDGDAVYAFASFAGQPPNIHDDAPVLHWQAGGEKGALIAEASGLNWDEAIPRLAGAALLETAGTPEESLELALRYQLVSRYTSLLLVHERGDGKSAGFPVLHQVPQMIAAGHGGFGSVLRSLQPKGLGVGPVRIRLDADDAAAFLKSVEPYIYYREPALSPLGFLRDFEAGAAQGLTVMLLLHRIIDTLEKSGPDRVLAVITAKVEMSGDAVSVLLLDWLRERLAGSHAMPETALDMLRQLLALLVRRQHAVSAESAKTLFEQAFAGISPDSWWKPDA